MLKIRFLHCLWGVIDLEIAEKIDRWILNHARELERVYYKFLFQNGDPNDVIEALKKFQTENGGFGNGLEPDCLNPNPSPIQSWSAIAYLDALKVDKNHPVMFKLLNYFEDEFRNNEMFPALIPSNNEYPRAIWWDYKEGHQYWGYNPSISIWAFMYAHRPSFKVHKKIEQAMSEFISQPKLEMHELVCFVEMYERMLVFNSEFKEFNLFEKVLIKAVDAVINISNSQDKNSYHATPLTFCIDPNSKMTQIFIMPLKTQLNKIIESLNSIEIWDITFHWQQYEKEFMYAKNNWQAIQAIKNLRFINQFYNELND